MTASESGASGSGADIRQICDAILEAVWDNEIGGTFEALGLMEDLPRGVWLAQSIASPDDRIEACLLITVDGQAVLLDRGDDREWQANPISDQTRRAIQDEGSWPFGEG
jgi:hypothetical protein